MSNSTDDSVDADLLPQWLWVTILVVAVAAVFGQAVSFGLINSWDDSLYFIDRPELDHWLAVSWRRRLLTPALGYPVPLPTALYALVRQAPGGLVVPLAHGLNVVFHAANALLVFALAKRWLAAQWQAGLVALIWAIHPLMAEPVAWVTNLKFVIMAATSLAGMYLWDRHLQRARHLRAADDDHRRRWWRVNVYGVAAAVCFVVGLTCQPQALSLGPALVAMTYFRADRQAWTSRPIWGPLAIMAAIGAAYLPVAVSGQHAILAAENTVDPANLSAIIKVFRAGTAFGLQAQHVVWPVGLQPGYFVTGAALRNVAIGGFVAMAAALGITGWALVRGHRAGWPLVMAWVYYLPVSGIDFLPRLTADPYMYVPLFGLLVAALTTARPILEWIRHNFRLAGAVSLAAILLLEAGVCVVQTRRWQNVISLMQPAIRAYPQWPSGYGVLATAYAKIDQPERAISLLETGQHTMYQHGLLSTNMPRLYEEQDQPARAANILMLMHTYRGRKLPDTEAQLLRVVVENKLPVESTTSARQSRLAEALADGIAQTAESDNPPISLERAAAYLAEIGATDLADQARRAATANGLDGANLDHL